MSVLVACPFCQSPNLFHTDFSDSVNRSELVAARGRFWKRIQNDHYPTWPIPAIRRDNGKGVHSKLLLGKDHFASKWQPLSVEILGCDFTAKPKMPPQPLFGIGIIRGIETSYILWNACRITHEEFSFVINLHWWPSHGRVFTVEQFDFESTAARSALDTALSLFAPGRGKPSEYFKNNKQFYEAIRLAVMRRYDEGVSPDAIRETDLAEELFPEANDDARTMRRWLQTSWRRWKWKDIVESIIESVTRDRLEEGGQNSHE